MSMLTNIIHSIFGKASAAPGAAAPASGAAASASGGSAGTAAAGGSPAATAGAQSGAGASAAPGATVDVAAILDKAVADQGEKLDWRHSIVDLMKALKLDSSIAARRDLAKDLHFDGDTNDSAKMNVWLHKQVMKKMAENGGKVPANLLD